jgi:hypothetical protein
MSVESDFSVLIIAIRKYLEDLNDSRLKPFLMDWPGMPGMLRFISPNPLPVFSYLPAVI